MSWRPIRARSPVSTALMAGLALALFGLGACGSDEALAVVTVDISAYAVPAELDLIRMETADAADPSRRIGRNFPVDTSQSELEVVLVRGKRLPRSQVLTVQGYRGTTLVATSDPTPVLFKRGELRDIRIDL